MVQGSGPKLEVPSEIKGLAGTYRQAAVPEDSFSRTPAAEKDSLSLHLSHSSGTGLPPPGAAYHDYQVA